MPVGVAGEGGRVTRVLVDAGTWVKAGQVLATVDLSVQSETAASLAAQVRVAEAADKAAQAHPHSQKPPVSRCLHSPDDTDNPTAPHDAPAARVTAGQATPAATRAAQ